MTPPKKKQQHLCGLLYAEDTAHLAALSLCQWVWYKQPQMLIANPGPGWTQPTALWLKPKPWISLAEIRGSSSQAGVNSGWNP